MLLAITAGWFKVAKKECRGALEIQLNSEIRLWHGPFGANLLGLDIIGYLVGGLYGIFMVISMEYL